MTSYGNVQEKRLQTKNQKGKGRSPIEDGSTTAEVFNTLDEGASKTEEWVVKNQNYIVGANWC
jgi:hypothetical protein